MPSSFDKFLKKIAVRKRPQSSSSNSSESLTATQAPKIARLFTPKTTDKVNFGFLAPLSDRASWSAIALINPSATNKFSGIIAKRNAYSVGGNHLTLWLKNGFLTAEADQVSRVTKLAPPINQWSVIGVSAEKDGTDFYMAKADGTVEAERMQGLQTGDSSPDLALIVGHLGDCFPGLIAFIGLYSKKLDDKTMRSICNGAIDPLSVQHLAFAWKPSMAGDLDVVTKRVPVITGTSLWPLAAPPNPKLLYPRVAPVINTAKK